MPTRITVIYDNPLDPAAFDAGFDDQLALAAALPGVERVESSRVWPKEDGSPTPAHHLLDLYFADYDAASRAIEAAPAQALLGDVLERGTGGVRITFADVSEVPVAPRPAPVT